MGILDAPAPARNVKGVNFPVSEPPGMSWTTSPVHGKLFVDQFGMFTTTYDPTTAQYQGGTLYYVDNLTGNDASAGTTTGSALQSLYVALAKSDVGTVMLKDNGVASPYYRGRGTNGTAITKNVNVIGYNGDAAPCVSTHDVLTYTLAAGQTKTFQATRSSVTNVVDMLYGTDGTAYTAVASIAAVEALAGSFWLNGSTLYVHPIDDRDLTNTTNAGTIWALLSVINFRNTGDFITYSEGVRWFGGSECFRAAGGVAGTGFATMNRSQAHLSQNAVGNNIAMNGIDFVLFNTDSYDSGSDGAGYHIANGFPARGVEINYRGLNSGHSSDDQNSSMHDGGKIIRVGGSYRTAIGANIADVNDGTESWNLGCDAQDSLAGYNFKCGNDSGTTKMWLDSAHGKGANYSAFQYGTGQLKVRGVRLERTNVALAAY